MTGLVDIDEREPPPLPTSLTEHAYHYLRQAILSGRLAVGAPLRQEKISSELGISRLPVREALRRLDTEGLVVLRPRRGYFVALLDTSEIEELFDIRALLETRAGYLAAIHRTDTDIKELSEILDSLEQIASVKPLDVSMFFKTNRLFHQRLFASSKRKHLCRLLGSVQDSVDPYIRMTANISSLEASQQDHRDLFEALKAGDGDLVARLCREHCENSCTRLIGLMRKVEQS
ncbi:GntR family transcriptional regulator [Microvirga sp. 3-52]|nr:GntR family transcriptional regulator [Microvirga sp. 3-52]